MNGKCQGGCGTVTDLIRYAYPTLIVWLCPSCYAIVSK